MLGWCEITIHYVMHIKSALQAEAVISSPDLKVVLHHNDVSYKATDPQKNKKYVRVCVSDLKLKPHSV